MVAPRPGEGRYARVEREQRWRLGALPDDAVWRWTIADRYLTATALRLRRVEDQHGVGFKLAQKVRAEPGDPEVVALTNLYLTEAEHGLLATLPGADLVKDRFTLRWAGRTLAVDRFGGRHEGLVLAEVELATDDPLLPPPPDAVADVTHDDRFSGGRLAPLTADELALLLDR